MSIFDTKTIKLNLVTFIAASLMAIPFYLWMADYFNINVLIHAVAVTTVGHYMVYAIIENFKQRSKQREY